jgi:hypothetical protein
MILVTDRARDWSYSLRLARLRVVDGLFHLVLISHSSSFHLVFPTSAVRR